MKRVVKQAGIAVLSLVVLVVAVLALPPGMGHGYHCERIDGAPVSFPKHTWGPLTPTWFYILGIKSQPTDADKDAACKGEFGPEWEYGGMFGNHFH